MTILNVSARPDLILLATDTEAVFGKDRQQVSKLYILPHLGAVVAGRGSQLMSALAYMNALQVQTFDGLMDGFDRMLGRIYAQMRPQLMQDYAAAGVDPAKQSVTLAGHSIARGRMVAFHYEQQDEAVGFTQQEIETDALEPWDLTWPEQPDPWSLSGMLETAKAQARRMPGVGGGSLILARMTPGAVELSTVREFTALAAAA